MRNFLLSLFLIPILIQAQYGSLDSTFGDGGIVYNTNLPEDIVNAIYTSFDYDDSENIFITGYYDSDQTNEIGNPFQNAFLIKYNSDGEIVSSFGENGFLKLHLDNWSTYGKAIAVKDNYLYYLVNAGHHEIQDFGAYFWVKLDLDGNIVQDFGNQGWKQLDYLEMGEITKILKLDNDELLIAGFTFDVGSPITTYIAKYDLNGDIVNSFGLNGQVVILDGYSSVKFIDIAQFDNGKLFVLTQFGQAQYDLHLLDSSGINIAKFDITQNDNAYYSMGVLGDQFYLSGSTENNNNYFLKKFNTSSMGMETSFGENGLVESDFGFDNEKPFFTLVSNNKVYQIGAVQDPQSNFGLTSHRFDGAKDLTFGTNGFNTTSIADNLTHYPSAAMFYGTERLLVLNNLSLSMACYRIQNILKVEDLYGQTRFQIVPNPASTTLQISGMKSEKTQVEILDLTGKLIKNFKVVIDKQNLDLTGIAKGIYIIKIKTNNYEETKNLIVQ